MLEMNKIIQYMAEQNCKKHDLGTWIDERTILLSSQEIFFNKSSSRGFFNNIVFPATQDTRTANTPL